jgi:hypothetical protein
MKDEDIDFACSSTFREGLPNLRVDYRASDTFAGPRLSARPKPARLVNDSRLSSLQQKVRELRSSCKYWEEEPLTPNGS